MELIIAIIVLAITSTGIAQELETFKASQCFKSIGIPHVSFSCPPKDMIKISRAFHGIAQDDRKNPDPTCTASPGHESTNCTFCPGDCIDDSMNLVYDWSTCMGNMSCYRTVMQSFMPECKGPDKFSDFLQVEYQCVPRPSVINMCSNLESQWLSNGGYLMSPNYPDHYPVNQDCMCTLKTEPSSKIILSFYDLLLETKNGRCRADWLMLKQNEQKHRHCGAIMTGTKNITSVGNTLDLQFHSDENNNVTQTFQYFTRILKGFWLYFSATSQSSIEISCRVLRPDDKQVQEIWLDDSEYDELINTRETNTPSPDDKDMAADKEDMADMEVDMKADMDKDKMKTTTKDKENDTLQKNDMKNQGKENTIDFQGSKESKKSGVAHCTASVLSTLGLLIVIIAH